MPRTKLPAAGSTYGIPLKDGRYGACRVLRRRTPEEIKTWYRDGMLVANSLWTGDSKPTEKEIDLEELRPLLTLSHHSYMGFAGTTIWIEEPPPEDFFFLGTLESTAEEASMQCATHGSWGGIRSAPMVQWRWDHDREALLAEEAVAMAEEAAEREREKLAEQERLASLTLEKLTKRRFFPDWYDYPPEKAKRASRKIMRETAKELLAIGKKASKKDKKAILKKCIEQFNALDLKMDHFIETDEAEAIIFEFDVLVHVCGVGENDLADEWRDW